MKLTFAEIIRRMTSRKLWMLIISTTLPWAMLERGVNHLYALDKWQAGVYGGMFAAIIALVGVGIAKYLNVPTTHTSTASVASALTNAATQAFERREEKVEVDPQLVQAMAERYRGEPSYRPLDTYEDLDR